MPKWGFESEWSAGAEELTDRLHQLGLVSTPELHRYHCECRDCDFGLSRFPLRAQTDSSCAGEIISSPFTSYRDSLEVATKIQDAAVEVDAEPGYQAGFHVHVDMLDRTELQKAHVLWGFMRWEPLIQKIAAGRFPMVRSNNNSVRGNFREWVGDPATASDRVESGWERNDFFVRSYLWYYRRDRHSNLNVRTRYNTFEFRVWNSTRTAWRMDLFTRLSVALCNSTVAERLASTPMPSQRDYGRGLTEPGEGAVDTFLTALRAGRQGQVADLLTRQLAYLESGRATDTDFTLAA